MNEVICSDAATVAVPAPAEAPIIPLADVLRIDQGVFKDHEVVPIG
jgi:hypothetical protein